MPPPESNEEVLVSAAEPGVTFTRAAMIGMGCWSMLVAILGSDLGLGPRAILLTIGVGLVIPAARRGNVAIELTRTELRVYRWGLWSRIKSIPVDRVTRLTGEPRDNTLRVELADGGSVRTLVGRTALDVLFRRNGVPDVADRFNRVLQSAPLGRNDEKDR